MRRQMVTTMYNNDHNDDSMTVPVIIITIMISMITIKRAWQTKRHCLEMSA